MSPHNHWEMKELRKTLTVTFGTLCQTISTLWNLVTATCIDRRVMSWVFRKCAYLSEHLRVCLYRRSVRCWTMACYWRLDSMRSCLISWNGVCSLRRELWEWNTIQLFCYGVAKSKYHPNKTKLVYVFVCVCVCVQRGFRVLSKS